MTSVADKLAQKSSRRTASKQVRLRLVHIDFWSMVKLTFLIGLCGIVISLITVALLWTVLVQTGVLSAVDGLLNDVSGEGNQVTVRSFVDLGPLMGFTLVASALNCVAGTALAAVGSFLYNLSVRLTGGLIFGFTNG